MTKSNQVKGVNIELMDSNDVEYFTQIKNERLSWSYAASTVAVLLLGVSFLTVSVLFFLKGIQHPQVKAEHTIVLLMMSAICFCWVVWTQWKKHGLRKDLKERKKHVMEGMLEEKVCLVSDAVGVYQITFNGEEFSVVKNHYESVEKGEMVLIHVACHSRIVLRLEPLQAK